MPTRARHRSARTTRRASTTDHAVYGDKRPRRRTTSAFGGNTDTRMDARGPRPFITMRCLLRDGHRIVLRARQPSSSCRRTGRLETRARDSQGSLWHGLACLRTRACMSRANMVLRVGAAHHCAIARMWTRPPVTTQRVRLVMYFSSKTRTPGEHRPTAREGSHARGAPGQVQAIVSRPTQWRSCRQLKLIRGRCGPPGARPSAHDGSSLASGGCLPGYKNKALW